MTTRRAFLTQSALGVGATSVARLPQLFASVDEEVRHPRRFIFIRKSNGIRPNEVSLPSFSEEEKRQDDRKEAFEVGLDRHELPVWLRGLEPYKRHLTILNGLSCKMSENGHWSYSSVLGAYKSGRNSLSGIKRATIDFELANLSPSPFGHVELSLTGNYSSFRTGIVAGYSAPAPHQRNYCYADPQTAYNELFKSVTNSGAVESENQMLRFLQEDEAFKAAVLTGSEARKIGNQVHSIEAIRRRNSQVEGMAESIDAHLPEISDVHADGGVNASTPEKQQAFTDILVASLVTGLTNVVTYTIRRTFDADKGLAWQRRGSHLDSRTRTQWRV